MNISKIKTFVMSNLPMIQKELTVFLGMSGVVVHFFHGREWIKITFWGAAALSHFIGWLILLKSGKADTDVVTEVIGDVKTVDDQIKADKKEDTNIPNPQPTK